MANVTPEDCVVFYGGAAYTILKRYVDQTTPDTPRAILGASTAELENLCVALHRASQSLEAMLAERGHYIHLSGSL